MLRGLAISLLLGLAVASPAAAEFLYGLTETHLVEIDPGDPSQARVIGPHGFGDRLVYGLDNVPDPGHPDGNRLIGLSLVDLGGGVLEFATIEYDVTTGAGTELAVLGTSVSAGFFDTIVWVEAEGSLVTTFGPDTDTSELRTLDPDVGTTTPIVDTAATDLDASAYDDVRDLYYGWDPAPGVQLQVIDRTDGTVTPLGELPEQVGDGAFSEEDGGLYVIDRSDGSIAQVQTTDGLAPIAVVPVGVVPEGPLRAIAFSPVPEADAVLALAIGAALLLPFARRRHLRHA